MSRSGVISSAVLLTTIGSLTVPFLTSAPSHAATVAPFALRVNAGGPAYTDQQGLAWQKDAYYSGGNTFSAAVPIYGSTAVGVYQSERWGDSTYTLPVPSPGTYLLRVHFDETYFTAVGQRLFNLSAQGQVIASNIDIFKAVGNNRPYVIQAAVAAGTSDAVTVKLRYANRAPKVSGIELLGWGAPSSDPNATTSVVASTITTPAGSTSKTTLAPTTTVAPPAAQPPVTQPPVTQPPATVPPTTAPSGGPTTTTPPSGSFLDGIWRPFSTTSPFNVTVPASPVIDPGSSAMVASLLGGHPIADVGPYGIPVYNADASTPRYTVPCTEPWGTCPLAAGTVPIRPAPSPRLAPTPPWSSSTPPRTWTTNSGT